MAYIIKQIFDYYHHLFIEHSDPRSSHLPFAGSPISVLALLGSYLYIVCNIGPKWMKNRKPIKIDNLLIIYNLIQVLSNGYFFCYAIYWTYWQGDYNFSCTLAKPTTDTSYRAMKEVDGVYMYFMLKMLDLCDTLFYVIRKQNSRISFLHVYHHSGMIIAPYIAIKFAPGGHSSFLGICNSFVHTFMYAYYLQCVLSKTNGNSVWFKKHMTQLQLVQFFMLIVHFGTSLLSPACQYPRVISFLMTFQSIFMLLMFFDFYQREYINKKNRDKPVIVKSVKSS